jgi:hypothetical protein
MNKQTNLTEPTENYKSTYIGIFWAFIYLHFNEFIFGVWRWTSHLEILQFSNLDDLKMSTFTSTNLAEIYSKTTLNFNWKYREVHSLVSATSNSAPLRQQAVKKGL